MKAYWAGAAALAISVPALANPALQEPMLVAQADEAPQIFLPANTEVLLRMNDTITTKGKALNEGDTFGLTVAQDVFLDGYVVIPRNSRATGRVTWMTSKGAFGKSGKMEIAIEYVEVSGRRIPLEGTFRQEGEGNTVATVGGVVAVGVFAGFVTGKSATIPRGRELMARTREDLPVRVAVRPRVTPAAPAVETPIVARERAPTRRARSSWGLVEIKGN